MSCFKKKKRVKDRDAGCIQQTNAQSQSGSAQSCTDTAGNGFPPPFASSHDGTSAVLAKRVTVRVRNKKVSNGQGQGQIVQSDAQTAGNDGPPGPPELV